MMSGDDLGARYLDRITRPSRLQLPKGEPIPIPCEGSNHRTTMVGTCAMCGRHVIADENGIAPEHTRDDIIARINRGDFG